MMAECRSDVAAAPPHSPSFSTLLGQGHTPKLKSYMLSKLNSEKETPQPPVVSPTSPSAPLSKPMPPLEPLLDSSEAPGSSAHALACSLSLPKKRARLSSDRDFKDDPTLLDVAVSSPLYLPDTPFSLSSRGDESDAYLEGSRFQSPTPESTAAVAGARFQRQQQDLDLVSLLPLSPPSCHLSPGYNMSHIFTEVPFSPTSIATSSPKAVSQPPSPACVVANSALHPQEITAKTKDSKTEGEDWLVQNGALDLSQLPKTDHLPQLVIASQFRDQPLGLHLGQTSPDTQVAGPTRLQATGPSRSGPIQMGGPQSSFQEVGQHRSGFQPVRPFKVRLHSGGPIRSGIPVLGPFRPVFQPSGAQGNMIIQHPTGNLLEVRQAFDAKPRPHPYHPRPVHFPRTFPPPLKPITGEF
ncbi:uncharacterized protein LOC122252905 [Penaeus japonicus]|uniref:uncharacterized protein LOC122252905 n=1 Tax=Penaeus japonicus TaxID=27405 RepID=UPI001C70F5D3|nr:uncharacterized protein LOC122252905 [Penaeus japonicus]